MINQTMPVIVRDDTTKLPSVMQCAILYAENEGEACKTLFCSEEEADKYMHEYERNGTLHITSYFTPVVEVYTPSIMLKVKIMDAAHVEYRNVTMPNPNIIE